MIIVASLTTIIFLYRDKDSKTQSNQSSDDFTIIDQKSNAVIKSKLIEKDGKKINYVNVEYNNYGSPTEYVNNLEWKFSNMR